jgi:hypothetical protein
MERGSGGALAHSSSLPQDEPGAPCGLPRNGTEKDQARDSRKMCIEAKTA